MDEGKRFMTLEEISEYLNERPATVRHWVQLRRIPFYKRGKRLQFDVNEIKQWDGDVNYKPIIKR